MNSIKVADNTLTAVDLAASSVTNSELANNAVNSIKISNNTVTAADIAANAITASELATNAVTSTHIAANTVTAADIAANAIGNSELANNAVLSANIATGNVANSDLATNSVTDIKIVNRTINPTTKLNGGACSSGQILQSNGTNFVCANQSGGADNLGNHTATQNIILNGRYLSGDGGNEGVFVATNGRVGVGTTNPTARLNIFGSPDASALQITDLSNDGGGMHFLSPEENEGVIAFGASLTQSGAAVGTYTAQSSQAAVIRSDNGVITFSSDDGLTNNVAYTPSEMMRITPSGTIGIGLSLIHI